MVLHRDLGYFAFGLTVIYAVSGLATNHRLDWDYDRATRVTSHQVGVPAAILPSSSPERRNALARDATTLTDGEARDLVPGLLRALGRTEPPKNTIWRSPERVVLYFGSGDEHTVEYRLREGLALETTRHERPLLYDMNSLHLNRAGGAYTLVADAYAGVLLFLALSGSLIARGSRGLRGRGGVLLMAGVLLPLGFLLWQRYL